MLKILSAQQIKELDRYTIGHEPIADIDLMERACHSFAGWLTNKFSRNKKIGIICGTGNNGGDGLGIARLIKEQGYSVSVWIIRGEMNESENFKINLQRLGKQIPCTEIIEPSDCESFKEYPVLIDAIFGSGLSREPQEIYAQVISYINQTDSIHIAVDIPSGLFADRPSSGEIVQATHTVTFQTPKLSFFLPENEKWVGEMHLVNIGLSQEYLNQVETKNFYLEEIDIQKRLKHRRKFSHKGSYGHALLIAGSYGKMGASVLASKAALRSGVGLLTTHTPKSGNVILQTAVPEAMNSADESDTVFTSLPEQLNYNSIGIGPGLGTDKKTAQAFALLLKQYKNPLVIDADALNLLAQNKELLPLIPENSILTPHSKEFERLVGYWPTDFSKLSLGRTFSVKTKCIIVLKGAHTAICSPDGNIYFNSTGNPGMATGGSGDVLTGILTGLLAQGYSSLDAALVGVYLHGLAGDISANELTMNTLIASDLTSFLSKAFKKIGV